MTTNLEQKYHFPLEVIEGFSIGLFEVAFNLPSQYVYRTTDAEHHHAMFIRRTNWHKLVNFKDEFLEIEKQFKKLILIDFTQKYYNQIR